jgi:hypothetical protein
VRTIVVPVAWEDGVEGRGEVRASVTDEEPEVPEPVAEVEGQVAGLLYRPVAGGVGRDAADVHPAGAVLDEHQHVQPGQRDSIHVQEIDSQDSSGLRVQELPPGRAAAARRGRPGLRRLLVSYFLAASLRCQASSVAGVTGRPPSSGGAG